MVLAALVLTAGCATVADDAFDGGVVVLPVAEGADAAPLPLGRLSQAAGPVELQFLGVAGWSLRTPRSLVWSAPLFTRPSLVEVGLGTELAPDSASIARAMTRLDVPPPSDAVAILVGHGHYDHALDVPLLMTRWAPGALVLANATVRLQLLPFAERLGFDPGRLRDVTDAAAAPGEAGRWIRLGADVRVMPVRTFHPPHFEDVTLYHGEREAPLPAPPGPATEWLDGPALSFLVDVLNPDGSVGLRIFLQDGVAADPPRWLSPPNLVGDSVPVDLALMVSSSLSSTTWPVETILQGMEPAQVLVQHWEDFFAPSSRDAEPLSVSALSEFLARSRRLMGCGSCVRVPRPGAVYRIEPAPPPGPGDDRR